MSEATYDAIIVLGKGVLNNGQPPDIIQAEIKTALTLAEQQLTTAVIFSGEHWGLIRKTHTINEAKAMLQFAQEQLTSAKTKPVLLLEEQAKDTIGNAVFCKTIIDHQNWKTILIMSTEYHLPRVRKIFNQIFGQQYSLHYQVAKQDLSWRQFLQTVRYELAAGCYAQHVLPHLRQCSNQQMQDWLWQHHFMYSDHWSQRLLRHWLTRPAHR